MEFQKAILKSKILTFLILLSFLFGYLEWGQGSSTFLFQAEYEVLSKLVTEPMAAAHPFTLIPLAGQIILLITLFQKSANRIWIFIGIGALAVLFLMILLVGILSWNLQVLGSALPFFLFSILQIRNLRKKN